MQAKIKLRLFGLLLTLFVFIFITAAILREDIQKKQRLLDEKNKYQSNLKQDLDNYRSDYIKAVEMQKVQNKEVMAEVKKTYEDLLSQQPSIIAQNQVLTTVTRPAQTIVKSTSQQGSSNTISVAKPKVTRQTQGS